MLYYHSEIKNKYKSTYQIRKALENKEIYKIEKLIYRILSKINHKIFVNIQKYLIFGNH